MEHATRDVKASDGTVLRLEQWSPEGEPRFVVAVVHGNGDHIGRFDGLARDLVDAGGLVFGFDLRGQGLSQGQPGHIDRYEDYTSDLRHVLLEYAAALPPSQRPDALPWFLFGHSNGGLVVLVYLLDHADDVPFRGVIVSAPLLGLSMTVPFYKRVLGKVAARVWPRFSLPSEVPNEGLSRDPELVDRANRDPRRGLVVSAAWFAALNRAIARVKNEVHHIEVPLLWYTGTADRIVDPASHRPVFERLRDPEGNDQRLEVFEGYYHELHNEPEPYRAPIIAMIRGWIEERLPAVKQSSVGP